MCKRLACLLCAFVLCFSVAAAGEAKPDAQRYDFDLTFSLNPEAVPARSRSRAAGYAELLDSLGLRGNITVFGATQSFDMNAELFYRNKPSVSVPFRFYGVPSYLYLTSPAIGNETLLFNMPALAEFSIKIKKSLETNLSSVMVLYPVIYTYNLWFILRAWDQYTGPAGESREISAEQISKLADEWSELLENDTYVNILITALASGSAAPEAVEAELNGFPAYLRDFVAREEPLTVEAGSGTETWRNAAGQTLFTREETENAQRLELNLPADEYRYAPSMSWNLSRGENSLDLSFDASLIRQEAALPYGDEEDEYAAPSPEDIEGLEEEGEAFPLTGGEEEYEGSLDDEEGSDWPETMLQFSASASSVPTVFPCDSSITAGASMKGVIYSNFDFTLSGKTEKDGSVSVSVCLPREGAAPAELLSCAGTLVPGPVESVPDFNYTPGEMYGNYNFFSFSEYYVAKFKNAVTRPLLKYLLDFVAEAPTSACQALLDDLTDSGIMNMMMSGQ